MPSPFRAPAAAGAGEGVVPGVVVFNEGIGEPVWFKREAPVDWGARERRWRPSPRLSVLSAPTPPRIPERMVGMTGFEPATP